MTAVLDQTQELIKLLRARMMVDPLLQQHLRQLIESVDEEIKLTYERFLEIDWPSGVEWVDGTVVAMSPASKRHQEIAVFLTAVLQVFVEEKGLGQLLAAPFQMKLATTGREPDILFVAKEHERCLQENFLDGPADMVVEIISPSSVGRDRGDKFYEYETAGVREYWLIDPDHERAEFYHLDKVGKYQLISLEKGYFHSQVVTGFVLEVESLWQDPLPRVMNLLRQLGVI